MTEWSGKPRERREGVKGQVEGRAGNTKLMSYKRDFLIRASNIGMVAYMYLSQQVTSMNSVNTYRPTASLRLWHTEVTLAHSERTANHAP